MGHETLWITQNVRTTALPRGGASPARLEFARGGSAGARLGKLGIAVVECLAVGRRRSLGPQADARPAAQVDRRATPQFLDLLLQGARANGFPNELWTLTRIAAVIRVHFGVRYHPAHVWKILRGLNWSCQVPERQPIQRDAPAIAHWKRYKWPAIQKSPAPGRPPRLPG
jgi:transposase